MKQILYRIIVMGMTVADKHLFCPFTKSVDLRFSRPRGYMLPLHGKEYKAIVIVLSGKEALRNIRYALSQSGSSCGPKRSRERPGKSGLTVCFLCRKRTGKWASVVMVFERTIHSRGRGRQCQRSTAKAQGHVDNMERSSY